MTRNATLWIGLALTLGCGAEVPADGGMQRIELGNQAHKPKAENPAAIQDNSFRPAEQKGDPAAIQDNSFRPNPAAIQDNTVSNPLGPAANPVDQKDLDATPQSGPSMVSKRETKAIEPAPAKDATAVKASVVSDQAKPGPATDVKIPPMK